jgi:lipopolysaccharide transport system permease protein
MASLNWIADNAAYGMLGRIFQYRKVVAASTAVELAKRYSGSTLGKAWLVLQPAILLSIYLFVYLVIFQVRFPGYGTWDFVLYVFCGLIPFLGFSESITTGSQSIKANLQLVHNFLMPIELIPVRSVLISMAGQVVSLGLLVLLVLVTQGIGPQAFWVLLFVLLQVFLLIGLVWVLSMLVVLLPDATYFINFAIMLLMFVSPIGFKPDMVPAHLRFVVYANPLWYMMELYREVLLDGQWPNLPILGVYVATCGSCFIFGAAAFARFKDYLIDYQ